MTTVREIMSADPGLRMGYAAENIERIEALIDQAKERLHNASLRLDHAALNLARQGAMRRHREDWRRSRDLVEEEEAVLASYIAHRERARRELLEITAEFWAAEAKTRGA